MSTNFINLKVFSKLKFRLTLVKNLNYFPQNTTLLPNLLNLDLSSSQLLSYSGINSIPQTFNDRISLISNYNISFILPLYGFLFITSDKLTTNQHISNQLLLKKLDSLENTIKNKPETNIELEEIIGGVMSITRQKKEGNTKIYNRYRVN